MPDQEWVPPSIQAEQEWVPPSIQAEQEWVPPSVAGTPAGPPSLLDRGIDQAKATARSWFIELPQEIANLGPRLFEGQLAEQVGQSINDLSQSVLHVFAPGIVPKPGETQTGPPPGIVGQVWESGKSIVDLARGMGQGMVDFVLDPAKQLREDPMGFATNAIMLRGAARGMKAAETPRVPAIEEAPKAVEAPKPPTPDIFTESTPLGAPAAVLPGEQPLAPRPTAPAEPPIPPLRPTLPQAPLALPPQAGPAPKPTLAVPATAFSRFLSNAAGSSQVMAFAASMGRFREAFADAVSTSVGTRPQFYRMTMETDPQVGGALMRAFTAKAGGEARFQYNQLASPVKAMLADGPTNELAARYVLSRDPRGIVPELTAEQIAAYQSNPSAQALVKWWDESVVPFLEQPDLIQNAGILKTDKPYARRVTYNQAIHGNEVAVASTELGVNRSWRSGVPSTAEPGMAKGGRIAAAGRRRASAGQKFTGKSTEGYVADLRVMAYDALNDRLSTAGHNVLRDTLISRAIIPEKGSPLPPGVSAYDLGDRLITTQAGGQFVSSNYTYLPDELGRAWEAYRTLRLDKKSAAWPGISQLNGAYYSFYLAAPVEAIAHGIGVQAMVAALPDVAGVKGPGGAALRLATVDPIARGTTALAKAIDLSGPDAVADAAEAARYGLFRTSHFAGPRPESITLADRTVGLLRRPVFGFPDLTARGATGLEARGRLVFYRAIREMNPDLTPAQATMIALNRGGTYVPGLEPTAVKVIRRFPFADPFASAGVAFGKTAVRAALGKSPTEKFWSRKFSPDLVAASLAAAIVAPYVYSEAFRRAGMGPGYGAPGTKHGDIPFTIEGKTYAIPWNFYAPFTARAANVLGIRYPLDAIMSGEKNPQELLTQWGIGLGNSASRFLVGPMTRAGLTAMTGKTMYLTRSGELMRVADPSIAHQWTNNFLSALEQSAPLSRSATELEDAPDHPAWRSVWAVLAAGGRAPRVRLEPREAEGAPYRARSRKAMDVAAFLGSRYMRAENEEKKQQILARFYEELGAIQDPAMRGAFQQAFWSFPGQHMQSIEKSRALSGAGEEVPAWLSGQ